MMRGKRMGRRVVVLLVGLISACVGEPSNETSVAGLTENARWTEGPWYGELRLFATARQGGGATTNELWESAWRAIERRAAQRSSECDRVGARFSRSGDRPEEVRGEGYALTLTCVPLPPNRQFPAAPRVDGAVAETAWWIALPWYKDLKLYASDDVGWERAWLALEELSRGYAAQCQGAGGRFAQRPGSTPYRYSGRYAGYFFWIDCFPSEQPASRLGGPDEESSSDEREESCDCDTTWGCDDCWCEPADECDDSQESGEYDGQEESCDCDTTWGCDDCWCEPADECDDSQESDEYDDQEESCDCDTTWGCDDCWCEPADECAYQ